MKKDFLTKAEASGIVSRLGAYTRLSVPVAPKLLPLEVARLLRVFFLGVLAGYSLLWLNDGYHFRCNYAFCYKPCYLINWSESFSPQSTMKLIPFLVGMGRCHNHGKILYGASTVQSGNGSCNSKSSSRA